MFESNTRIFASKTLRRAQRLGAGSFSCLTTSDHSEKVCHGQTAPYFASVYETKKKTNTNEIPSNQLAFVHREKVIDSLSLNFNIWFDN
jgi:hypothetical protein